MPAVVTGAAVEGRVLSFFPILGDSQQAVPELCSVSFLSTWRSSPDGSEEFFWSLMENK